MLKQMLLLLACGCGVPSALADDGSPATVPRKPELRSELLRRVEADQAARREIVQRLNDEVATSAGTAAGAEPNPELERAVAQVKEIDRVNTQWLREVIEQHGWPTITLVGRDGSQAAWLLVQHADADPAFQRRCLDLMNRLPKAEVSPAHRAYLTDRVLLAEGKRQIYGTQFTTVDGKLTARPLEDEGNVDRRRAEVGLPPLAEYVKLLEQQYGRSLKEHP